MVLPTSQNNCTWTTVHPTNTKVKLRKCPCSNTARVAYPLKFSSAFAASSPPVGPLSPSSVPPAGLLVAGEARGATARVLHLPRRAPHPPDLLRPDLVELLAHVPGAASLLRPAMAASRRGDLLLPAMAAATSFDPTEAPPHLHSLPIRALPGAAAYCPEPWPGRRPPAPSHGRGHLVFLPARRRRRLLVARGKNPRQRRHPWENILDFFRRRMAGISRKFRFF
jgi:hypothetical protein